MTKKTIFDIVKGIIIEIVPEISESEILIEKSLKSYGINSIDRMDIVINAMEALKLRIPFIEFGQAKNIQGMVDLLYEKKSSIE